MNTAEFRRDLSKHLNQAVNGEPVYFTRAGQTFKLEVDKPTDEFKTNFKQSPEEYLLKEEPTYTTIEETL